MNELSRREEMSLSGAALRGAPWKAATIGGVAAGAGTFLLDLLDGSADLSWSTGLGIALFTLIAAIGSVSRPDRGDRVTRQARVWSLRHPWRFSLYPAAGAAILLYPVQLILDGDGVFGAAWSAAWGGALIYLISGLVTMSLRGRADSAR
ncbi:hypothetical protein AB0K60_21590 [Thermopolyspora sp. NPDC052614]|uniref:hypothetical protein n=1 Tax=Thermopolyspora sp. NPDC052614 TaxID=3155682 RepID=UPI00342EFA2C